MSYIIYLLVAVSSGIVALHKYHTNDKDWMILSFVCLVFALLTIAKGLKNSEH